MTTHATRRNAFTHGYGDTPHGYTPGGPVKESPVRASYQRGGFGKNNGTIKGMGAAKMDGPAPHKFNVSLRVK